MAFEIRQQIKLSQQLRMTPMLKQSINLLLFSRQELVDAVRRELLENPLLEEKEPEAEPPAQDSMPQPQNGDSESAYPWEKLAQNLEWEEYLGEFSSQPRTTQQDYETPEEEHTPLEARHSAEPGLEAHLMGQLILSSLSDRQKRIGECIIGNLDDSGYLTASDAEIASLAEVAEEDVAPVLHVVQNFDPVGVAARSLPECLLVQIRARNYDRDPILVSLVRDHLEDLEKNRYKPLLRRFGIDLETLKEYLGIIQSLEPRPGGSINSSRTVFIQPDVFVHKVNGEFVIVMNDEDLPNLQISPLAEKLPALQENHCSSREYLNERLRSATWLIHSLEERRRTLYLVTESIVRHQREFFEHGAHALKPLVLKDVAEDIGRSESSVSRISTNKYVGTPYGIFELKYFFNSALSAKNGGQVGSESVKAHIRTLIGREDSANPLSDEDLGAMLKESLGIQIARRTVAKYREALGIPSSSRRRKAI